MNGSPIEPKQRVHQVVAADLRQLILAGEVAVGERLPTEDLLMEQYGVARTTMREALRVLESQGLIEVRRGRNGGPVVTELDLDPTADALAMILQIKGTRLSDLGEALSMIEPPLAGRLAAKHSPTDISSLRASLDDASAAAEADDFTEFAAAALRFHGTLVTLAGNTTLSVVTRLLQKVSLAYYGRVVVDREVMELAVRSYTHLVDLIEAGDVAGAEAHWFNQHQHTMEAPGAEMPVTYHAAVAVTPKDSET